MKYAMTLSALLLGAIGVLAVTSEPAHAVVYCTYTDYPTNCVVRPGVRLVARPVARAAVHNGHRSAGNRNGGVNRVGRRR
jgi:hypothetical protein